MGLRFQERDEMLVYHYRDKTQKYRGIISTVKHDAIIVDVPVMSNVIVFDPDTQHEIFNESVGNIDGWGNTVWRLGSLDRWIDFIYNEIDDLLRSSQYDKVDAILDQVNVRDTPLSILIGYLTITLPLIQEWNILQGDNVHRSGHVSKARENLFFRVLNMLREDEESERRTTRLLGGLGLDYYKDTA